MKPLRHHLERIQNGDEATKHFWLYALSSVSMLFVLVLWGGYMNLAIPGVPGAIAGADQKSNFKNQNDNTETQITQSPTSIFMAGLETVVNGAGIRISKGIAVIKEKILPSSAIIKVDKKAPQFIMKGLENLPEGILPK